MSKKVLIFGRTGSGKTTLARALQPLIGGVVLDGDAVRLAMHTKAEPGDHHERWMHAKRMAALAEIITVSGNNAICSFVCPTRPTRTTFDADFTIWMDRNGDGKYPDTQAMFEEPSTGFYDLRVTNGHPPQYWAGIAADMIQPVFNPLRKTALFVGRYQPFHDGHKALIEEGIKKYGQVCIGVRDQNRDWPFERVKLLIDFALRNHIGKYNVVPLPNITAVCYGRNVGYDIERIHLSPPTEAISGTALRELANGHPREPTPAA